MAGFFSEKQYAAMAERELAMKLSSQQSQAKYAYLLKDRILAFYSCFSLTD